MKKLKLTIDPLPRGAWGNDLSKTLSSADWGKIRNYCIEKADGHCQICGEVRPLCAHEIWDFDIENKTQTLKDIVAICSACHGVKHMRNSQRLGYGMHAKTHFLKVNECSESEFREQILKAELFLEERNKILRWKMLVDLNKFGAEGIEFVQKDIPLISNPYEEVNWPLFEPVLAEGIESRNLQGVLPRLSPNGPVKSEPIYYVMRKGATLPPYICHVRVNKYSGKIFVISERTKKIYWLLDTKPVSVKYNVGDRFSTDFSVENLKGASLQFVLEGEGGYAMSLPFCLTPAFS